MILHVNFSDGSNPWVCFSDDRREIAEHWRDWMKYHPEEAQPVVYCGDYVCTPAGEKTSYLVYKRGKSQETAKYYKYLGHALNFIGKGV